MNQIILASHGGLAAGAKDTLEMVLGDVSNVHVVSLARDDKEPITNKVEAMIATFNADDTVYVLTDMLGSSVNNNMVELSKNGTKFTVVSGFNIPLALTLAMSPAPVKGAELAALINEARTGLTNPNAPVEAAAAPAKKAKATALYQFDGLAKVPVTEATAGNIIAMSGIGDITIGDTICAPDCVEPMEFVKISAPTIEMTFSVNDSPFAGKEGKFVTSRQLRDRLFRETLKDVSLKVTEMEDSTDSFNVAGRGEMSLSILMETMRREGYEFQVSPPRVLYQEIDGKKCEPIERLVADVPNDCVGAVMEKLGSRKGEFQSMNPVGNRTKLEFLVPSRGLFGYRNEFLTDTKGEGIMASVFEKYAPMKGEIQRRSTGSLVAFETGDAVTYGLFNAQERGTLFIGAGVPVYAGMIVGETPKAEDISVNVCKKKQLTNMRASGSDDALRLTPPKQMSLEQCLEFLADDELLECTPENLRLRKRILDHGERMKLASKKKG